MINGFGGKKTYFNEYDQLDQEAEVFFERPQYPHSMAHKNRSNCMKNEENESISEIFLNNREFLDR